jgi:predicted DNA-binding protein (MmcQ/YjbR family)
MAGNVKKVRAQLREFALGLPETTEDLPWGERVAKVKKKVFVFLGRDMDPHFGLGVKLPRSNKQALALPFTEPTGYGLGKSGWVSAKFAPDAHVSFELVRGWVLESYAAVAPKTLAARVPGAAESRAAPARKTKATVKPEAPARAKAKAPAKRAPKAATKARPVPPGKATPVALAARAGKRAPKRQLPFA